MLQFFFTAYLAFTSVCSLATLNTPNQINNWSSLTTTTTQNSTQTKRKKNSLDELLWFKQKNCRNKSIDIDFCLLNQLINQSNHIEYKSKQNSHTSLNYFEKVIWSKNSTLSTLLCVISMHVTYFGCDDALELAHKIGSNQYSMRFYRFINVIDLALKSLENRTYLKTNYCLKRYWRALIYSDRRI